MHYSTVTLYGLGSSKFFAKGTVVNHLLIAIFLFVPYGLHCVMSDKVVFEVIGGLCSTSNGHKATSQFFWDYESFPGL